VNIVMIALGMSAGAFFVDSTEALRKGNDLQAIWRLVLMLVIVAALVSLFPFQEP